MKNILLCILLALGTDGIILGQITITNLMETQYGKLPNETADFFLSFYDRTEVDFRKKGLSVSATIEQYHTAFEGRSYTDLSQFTLGYKKKSWDFKLGNFYETLGRGALLRSFEIPGALLEDIGFRSRNYFHRDILGGSASYTSKKVNIQILSGGVLNNVLPPTFERADRRVDIVTVTKAKYKYNKGHEAGLIAMRHEIEGSDAAHYLSATLDGRIIDGLDYYVEYSSNIENNRHALYAGLTASKGAFSASLEYKKYQNFIIGAGINEPPAGVKQQTYRVLNRSIHVPNPLNEQGYQVDLFYRLEDGTVFNLNHSLANNQFGAINTTFFQYFIEVQSSIGEKIDYKLFVDYSKDPFKGEPNRYSAGLYTDIEVNPKLRITPEVEYQAFDRGDNGLYNFNMLMGLNYDSKLFVSVLSEWTNDPFIIKDDQADRMYLGGTLRYQPNYKHTFQLFLGERRGGPQCAAGVCYEILDFKGFELRWIGKFRA